MYAKPGSLHVGTIGLEGYGATNLTSLINASEFSLFGLLRLIFLEWTQLFFDSSLSERGEIIYFEGF